MQAETKCNLEQLELALGKPMFSDATISGLEDKNLGADERDIYFTGCGSEFGCGE